MMAGPSESAGVGKEEMSQASGIHLMPEKSLWNDREKRSRQVL
jgi:hypothetical protein